VEDCLGEAVLGFVACFATVDVTQPPQRTVRFGYEPASEAALLVELLGTASQVVNTQNAVPVRVTGFRTPEGGLTGEFEVVDSSTVDVFGSPPPVVGPEARVRHEDGSWRCEVAVGSWAIGRLSDTHAPVSDAHARASDTHAPGSVSRAATARRRPQRPESRRAGSRSVAAQEMNCS
jgi:hypothetical protein